MAKLPEYLFVSSCDGALHDTRQKDWSKRPLRANYSRGHLRIKTVADLKATLRNGAYAWPGGYPLYLLCADGGTLHFDCARKNVRRIISAIADKAKGYRDPQWECVACDINWEDSDLYCDECNGKIESAYGGDSEESETD